MRLLATDKKGIMMYTVPIQRKAGREREREQNNVLSTNHYSIVTPALDEQQQLRKESQLTKEMIQS